MKEWVIEEYPAYVNKGDLHGKSAEWYINPGIYDKDDTEDMEPDTLEACIKYLSEDPFNERNKYWVIRLRNVNTGETIPFELFLP